MGAQSISAELFEAEVEAAHVELGHLVRAHGRPKRISPLRDAFERRAMS
jgi:hypothetical protein